MTLDHFIQIYKWIALIGFIISLFGFVYFRKSKANHKIIKSIIFALIGSILILSYTGLVNKMRLESSSEIARILKKESIEVVFFNDYEIEQSKYDSIKLILASLNTIEPHHSHPLDISYYLKVITENDSIILEFVPDSEVKNEYWVFNRKYKTTSMNELGQVRTKLFNDYIK
jgi:hypothetical protein